MQGQIGNRWGVPAACENNCELRMQIENLIKKKSPVDNPNPHSAIRNPQLVSRSVSPTSSLTAFRNLTCQTDL